MYSQSVNQYSEEFKHIQSGLKYFVQQSLGGAGSQVATRAKILIVQNLTAQAFVRGIADDFLAGAAITITILLPLIFLKYKKKKNSAKVKPAK